MSPLGVYLPRGDSGAMFITFLMPTARLHSYGARLVSALFLTLLMSFAVLSTRMASAQEISVDMATKFSLIETSLRALVGEDLDSKFAAIAAIGVSGHPLAREILDGLADEGLLLNDDITRAILRTDSGFLDLRSGARSRNVPASLEPVMVTNALRSALDLAKATAALSSQSSLVRKKAARSLQLSEDPEIIPVLEASMQKESDPGVILELKIAVAMLRLQNSKGKERLDAVYALGASDQSAVRQKLSDLLRKKDDGSFIESDVKIRQAAELSLKEIQARLTKFEILGNLFSGISLGSVLLLAALGLAITYGLMGVINMAHGEFLMIGAYVTFVTQSVFRIYFPEAFSFYVLAAIPAAFLVTALLGIALERTVLRWLYGRPLETLLTTWGVSLFLMQICRSIFGAQNVEVENPSWLSGAIPLAGDITLPWNRIIILGFSLLVLAVVAILITRTRAGLYVRGVTQNRSMAACTGVATDRVDMLTFGFGSGIAGLGGVALSQIGNVGPDLGQQYIVDSFMVVVLGGVGQLAGTVIAALGLGSVTKMLEPMSGAVLAKIFVLIFIILFIQKRPQGLFALKGRSAET